MVVVGSGPDHRPIWTIKGIEVELGTAGEPQEEVSKGSELRGSDIVNRVKLVGPENAGSSGKLSKLNV